MPEMIKKQVEDTVAPLMLKQADMLNTQVNTAIQTILLPRVEQQMRSMAVHDGPSSQSAIA